MYATNNPSGPMQLIEKAQSFSEDDDLLSPYDTGEVEKQMKRAWWKTCSLFTFLLATLGIVMFIIIRDNHDHTNNGGADKNQLNIHENLQGVSKTDNNNMDPKSNSNEEKNNKLFLPKRGELPTSMNVDAVGNRVTIRQLYDPNAKECVTSLMNTLIENGELNQDRLTISNVETGFSSILNDYGSLGLKTDPSMKEYQTKESQLEYYSTKLNKEFELKSLTVNGM